MVKLHTSLLAIALATGSALASSNEFQRREQGLVAREVPIVRYGFAPSRLDPRGFVLDLDEEDPFVRDLEPFDDLEAREPVVRDSANKAYRIVSKTIGKIFRNAKVLATGVSKSLKRREYDALDERDTMDLSERDLDIEELLGREYDPLDERDSGDLFERDLDTEEFFGREYDLLNERDAIDSEDLFERDLEAGLEEPFEREYDLLDEEYY